LRSARSLNLAASVLGVDVLRLPRHAPAANPAYVSAIAVSKP
jgi:hypothetical protein